MNPSLKLIAPQPEHAAMWYKWRQQLPSTRYNPMKDHSVEQLAERLANSRPDLSIADQEQHRWIVTYNDEPIGTAGLESMLDRLRHGEIAYQLDERFHGRGLGRLCVTMLVEKIFAETRLHRLFATVSAPNIASIKLVESVGFTREGCLRDHFLINGAYMDVFFYGLLRDEHDAANHFEKKTAPEDRNHAE